MLRIGTKESSEAAKKYFSESLEPGDYYVKDFELPGQWAGKGAQMLGLSGEINKEDFYSLCDNKLPGSEHSLTARTKGKRRVGYDFNFNCPKGVTLAFELTQDERILDAFRASIQETMQDIETDIQTRVRKNNQDHDRNTGNIAYGQFIHRSTRPLDNGYPDPHLHAHCFVFNATFDSVEKQWKAAQFGDIKRDANYYEAIFHARLSLKIRELGYEIQKSRKFWDIAGIPKELLQKFSKRTEEIEAIAKEKGITNPDEKAKLGALTRNKKNYAVSQEELRQQWLNRLGPNEKTILLELRNNPSLTQKINDKFTEAQAMKYAIADAFERQSVISEKRLLAQALHFGVGKVTVEGMKRQLHQKGLLKAQDERGQSLITHEKVKQEEVQLIHFVKESLGQFQPLCKNWKIQRKEIETSLEQAAALQYTCQSQDRVIAITGKAGTGKTTVMAEIIDAIESRGKKVFVYAPSSSASRGVLKEDGIKHKVASMQQAQTVQYLLKNKSLHNPLKNQVIWIDEAGLLSAPTLNGVFKIAKEHNCRVILSGDTGQHHSVDRGDALKLLEKHAGLKSAQITKIWRQKDPLYKEAVEKISQKDYMGSFKTLDQMGSIIEQRNPSDRSLELARHYLNSKKQYKSVLVVSPSHVESNAVTQIIRSELKRHSRLGENETKLTRYQNLSLNNAHKLDPRSYQEGMIIRFHQNRKGIKKGESWEVTQVDRNTGDIFIEKGEKKLILPIKDVDHYDLYEKQSIRLAPGDHIRITENSSSAEKRRLNNGDLKIIKEVKETGEILLEGGYTLPKGFGNFSYGYCVTSHASQGKTVDCLIVAQSKDSLTASSMEQFYVSISRGRLMAKVYTHNKEELMQAVARDSERLSVHDLNFKPIEVRIPASPKVPPRPLPSKSKTVHLDLDL